LVINSNESKGINPLNEAKKSVDDDDAIPRVERKYREILRLAVEVINLGSMQFVHQSTELNLEKLLSLRPSIEDMKLILEPMCYLSNSKLMTYGESLQRYKYQITLQQQLIEYFLDKYNDSSHHHQ
jgi:hypothetical protein